MVKVHTLLYRTCRLQNGDRFGQACVCKIDQMDKHVEQLTPYNHISSNFPEGVGVICFKRHLMCESASSNFLKELEYHCGIAPRINN